MSSEFIAAQSQKDGTRYIRFIRVPQEINQSSNTVVLIKNSNQNESSTIAKVQKHVQPAKIVTAVPVTTENTGGKKVKTRRDDYRRFQHNQIERARREKINNWIMELGKIIDDNSDDRDDDNTTGQYNTVNSPNHTNKNGEALSKGGILEKACEYISHLKSVIKSQQQSASSEEMSSELKRLTEENELLRMENTMLKRKYHMEGITEDDDDCLIKRTKSECDEFKLDIEFGDSLPGDDIAS